MENQIIQKFLNPSIELIKELLFSKKFKVTGGADFIDGKEIEIIKDSKQFKLSFVIPWKERKYFNSALDTVISEYSMQSESGKVFLAPLRSTLLNSINEVSSDPINNYVDFIISGSLSQITTAPIDTFDNSYHRILIPVNDDRFSFKDYQHWFFKTDLKTKNNELIKIKIKDYDFHFYTFKIDDKVFWAVDSFQKLEFRTFQEISFSIFNAFGFLEGDLHLNEYYYFISPDQTFQTDLHIYYSSARDSIITGYGIYTTNPYSVLVPLYKSKGEEVNHEEVKKWYDKLIRFNSGHLSKLAECFWQYDSLSRAALIVLEANVQALELKAASYCVAYEAICHTIKNKFGIDSPNVINEDIWNKTVKPDFINLINKLRSDSKIDETQERILLSKLNNWNQPTNRDSLTAPFKKYGYNLNPQEYKCIDNRNKFLHGSLPVNEKDETEAFHELYFISMTIHKLIYVLVLKLIGFDGYIINYPKLHEHITGVKLEEDVLVNI